MQNNNQARTRRIVAEDEAAEHIMDRRKEEIERARFQALFSHKRGRARQVLKHWLDFIAALDDLHFDKMPMVMECCHDLN